mmetsp:Transcript_32798/g.70900  ORF Transcript_32798/g.70900 Transcript_32798/m.70900 type:complete len:288 (+) Transcript_32798:210-1073(+)
MNRFLFLRKKPETASSQESSRLFDGPESSGSGGPQDGGAGCSDGSPPATDACRTSTSDSVPAEKASSQRFGSSPARALSKKFSVNSDGASKGKVCLICLESLDECDSSEVIALDCDCRGDIRWRHLKCALKWAQVKGSNQCDICKKKIQNLPDIESLPPPDLVEPITPQDPFYLTEEAVPPALDLSFDFLRITWIATIVCVLFVQLDLQESLWIGSIVGLCYILMIKVIECCSNRVRRFRSNEFPNTSDTESNTPSPQTQPQRRGSPVAAWYTSGSSAQVHVITPPV